jgi:hypothetical protein
MATMVPTAVPVTGQNRSCGARAPGAVTVEQCWHRVPGGTATSVLGMLEALYLDLAWPPATTSLRPCRSGR